MSSKVLAGEARVLFTPKVVENAADHFESVYRGIRTTIEELPHVLNTVGVDLEKTDSYKEKGYVWFRIDTRFISADYYEFISGGKTLSEMFVPVKDNVGKTLHEGGDEKEIEINWKALSKSGKLKARFFGQTFLRREGTPIVNFYGNKGNDEGVAVIVNGTSRIDNPALVAVLRRTLTDSEVALHKVEIDAIAKAEVRG